MKDPFMCPFCNEKHGPFSDRCKNRIVDVARALRDNTESKKVRSQEGHDVHPTR